jgi:predicted ATPase/class 3 adenylate cyclase/Tfp pilus assembly protein PilF
MNPSPLLPSGTLTFLFTDIEGSTSLWEQYPDLMRSGMVRHDALIEAAVTSNQGVIVKPRGEGDSRFAVFSRASDALQAAVDIQRSIAVEAWPLPIPIKVRIGIHSGEADLYDNDYYGPAVNRAARIRSVAHGGQTLLSSATFMLVQDALPESVGLRDLGELRLKDILRIEHVYQLVVGGLQAEFPPLRGLDGTPTNLPSLLNSFVGREEEITQVKKLLSEGRLITVTGMGGSGKTRLALEVGSVLLDEFPDGVWLVDLAPISHPDFVTKEVAGVFEVRESEEQSLLQSLVDHLRGESLLLILDNCEHVLNKAAQLANRLIRDTAGVKILATSREPMGLAGEIVWTIPPLSFPKKSKEVNQDDLYLEAIQKYDSVRLFVDRATAARPGFRLSRENMFHVAEISRKLEGIPLAIELAAARAKVLTVRQITERLEIVFRLLVSSSRDLHPRQHTLRAMIDWSYNLLMPNEQTLLMRLGIFQGGWSLEAAEAVCSSEDIDSWEILDLLTSLVDKSLVVPELHDNLQRYRFLEMLRQYALERLEEAGDLEATAFKHASYFLEKAQNSYGEMWGPNQSYWLGYWRMELDNLRGALEWMKADDRRYAMLLQLAGSMWRFWEIDGHIGEGRTWLELALQRNEDGDVYERANGLRGAGNLARAHGDYVQARVLHEKSLDLFRSINHRLGIARQLDVLGEIYWMEGDPQNAIKLSSESLALHQELGNKEGIAAALENLGFIARDGGDYKKARELFEQCLKIHREMGNIRSTASVLSNLGLVAYLLCEYQQAIDLFQEAISIYQQQNDNWSISETLANLGNVAKDQGYFQKATALYNQCLEIKKELGDRHGIARGITGLAEVAFFQGNYPLAIDLGEKSLAMYKEHGVKRGVVVATMILAVSMVYQGDIEGAEKLTKEALSLSSVIETPRSRAYTLIIYGLCEYNRGDLEKARQHHQEALDIFREVDDGRSIAQALVNLARTAYRQGDRASALEYLEESLTLSRQLDTRWSLAFSLEILGLIKRSENHLEEALNLFKESLELSVEQGNRQGIANCLGALAGLAAINNQPAQSARMFAAAASIREAMGVRMGEDDQREYERHLVMLQQALDEEQFKQLMLEGCTISIEEAINMAQNFILVPEAGEEQPNPAAGLINPEVF